MDAISVDVCRPGELGSAELGRWHALLGGAPELDNPFLGPELARAVGDVRGDARVAVAWHAGRIAGFFPYLQTRMATALPISGPLGTSQAFVCEPGLTWSWRQIAAGAGLATVEMRYLVGSQAHGGTFRISPSPVVDTSAGFGTYLARVRGRKFLKTVLYKQRKLEREVGPVDFHFGAADPAGIRSLVRWKSEQYRRTGRRDPFAQPWVRALVDRLADEDGRWLGGVFSAVRAGGTLVAADFSLRTDAVLSCWFGAYDPAFAAFSPGAVRTLRMIEAAASAGIARLELSAGDESYKDEWKTGDGLAADGFVTGRGPIASARNIARRGRAAARDYALGNDRLRRSVRRSLRGVGSVRTAVRSRPSWDR